MLKAKKLSIILGALVLVIIFLLLTKSYSQGSSLGVTAPSDLPENTVWMTEEGFMPETITVKKGTRVTFVNKSKSHLWPASDLHPTHTIYPEFDPKQPVAPDTAWEFTFEQPGTWNYHDHLSPLNTGKVIVNE